MSRAKKKLRTGFPVRFLSATATRFAIARAFFALFTRRRVHVARIIALGFPTAVGARHFVRVYAHQLVKSFTAGLAFVLK